MTDYSEDIEAIARAFCADSPQASNAATPNDKGKSRYQTIQDYVDAHWQVYWPSRAELALKVLKERGWEKVVKPERHDPPSNAEYLGDCSWCLDPVFNQESTAWCDECELAFDSDDCRARWHLLNNKQHDYDKELA